MSIYDRISSLQAATPWGSVLDAGSGQRSSVAALAASAEHGTLDRGHRLAADDGQHVAEVHALALAHAAQQGGLRHGHDWLVLAEAA